MAKKVENNKVVRSVTIDPFILESALEYAEKERRSFSSLVEHLLAVHLINEKKKEHNENKKRQRH